MGFYQDMLRRKSILCTYKTAIITKVKITLTPQLPPEHFLDIPMNFRMIKVSQNTVSRQFRIAFALVLAHLLNRCVCSVSN
jgi:hypothetical protein